MAFVAAPPECGGIDLKCKAAESLKGLASSAASDALEEFANAVKEGVGEAVASVGTMWMMVDSPELIGDGSGGAPAVQAGDTAGPAAESGVLTFLQYAATISLAVCVLALIVVGARMALETRRQDAEFHMTRVMTVLVAAILISAATAITTAVMPGRSEGEPTVALLENSLWYYTAAAVVLSVIVGSLRMAWEQRADPGKDLLRSLLTFIVVSGAGLTVISLLIAAGDAYAGWILGNSLECSVEADSNCFGENMMVLLSIAGAGGGVTTIAVIILGIMAFVASLVQLGMMIARSGMLIILAGALPLAASATNTVTGKQMFQKFTGWIIALILYKPAAAIIYAAAFHLAGSPVLGGGLDDLGKVIVGLFMMFLAVAALPALMRLVVPAVGAMASGNAAGGMALAAGAAIPTGAVAAGQLMGGGSGSGGGMPSGSGEGGGSNPSGSSSPPGGGGGPDSSSGATESGGGDQTPSGGGSSTPPSGGADAAGGGSGMTGAAEAGGSAAGGGAAAAGGGAAAAAGPVGAGVAAAGSVASTATDAAKGAAQIGEDAMGEGDEPSGSS